MRILEAGHKYLLQILDADEPDDGEEYLLEFLKREGDNFPFNIGKHQGTNCQEVLRALIDRTKYLQSQKPCAETEAIIGLLKTALLLFEIRAARIHSRQIDWPDLEAGVRLKTCEKCGHIDCEGCKS